MKITKYIYVHDENLSLKKVLATRESKRHYYSKSSKIRWHRKDEVYSVEEIRIQRINNILMN